MALAWQNTRWAEALINTLVVCGVQHFFIAPGSRNAPLSMACLRLSHSLGTRCHTFFDERSLAFCALGAAKASDTPTVVITTSGSAVANLLPAAVEASQLALPLILLTADRPEELIGVGANQAIAQPGLFSHFVRYAQNLPLPDDEDVPEQLALLAQQVLTSLRHTPGPIHLNVPLREPLYVEPSELDSAPSAWPVVDKPILPEWLSAREPATDVAPILLTSPTVLVAGELQPEEAEVVLKLAEALQLPLLADIGSQLRQRQHPNVLPVPHFLAQTGMLDAVQSIVQFGGRLVSKPLNQWLESTSAPRYLFSASAALLDPSGRAVQRQVCAVDWPALLPDTLPDQTVFNQKLLATGAELSRIVGNCTQSMFSEYSVADTLSKLLPADHALMLGNSLSIRLFDQVAVQREQSNRVYCNRGASGIDGLIATSAGLALVDRHPVTAMIGDMSALYDLNSLAWLRNVTQTMVLVVLNNDGGQIFSMLPAAQQTDVFDAAFLQPHGLDFRDFCAGFGVSYQQVSSESAFRQSYQQVCGQPGGHVIEVTVPSHAFRAHHALIQSHVHGR